MAATSKLEKLSWIAGIVGVVFAAIGLAVTFRPHATEPGTPGVQQRAGAGSTQISQITGGTVTIMNQMGEPISHSVPNVYNLTYDSARKALVEAGWIPNLRPWVVGDSADIQSGSGPALWSRGYRELESCSGTGEGFCRFLFYDPQGHVLVVITAGEEDTDAPANSPTRSRVAKVHLETADEKTDREAEEKTASEAESQEFLNAINKAKASAGTAAPQQ